MNSRMLVAIILLCIMLFAVAIRAVGYFELDGSTRWPWLRNIDSYHFLKYTSLVLEGKSWDNNVLAPVGGWYLSGQFVYPTLAAGGYRIVQLVSSMPLDYYMAWFPAILAALVAIPAYFIGKLLYDKKVGLLFAFFVTIAPQFVSRSLGGDPDSDVIAMLMFMLSMLAITLMIKCSDKQKILTKKNIYIGIFAGLVFGVFIYSWSGFWFPFMLFSGFLVIKLLTEIVYSKSLKVGLRSISSMVFCFALAWGIFWIMSAPVYGAASGLLPIQSPLLGTVFKGDIGSGVGSFFPNVAVSIAELQSGGDARGVMFGASSVVMLQNMGWEPIWLFMIFSPAIVSFMWLIYLAWKRIDKDLMLLIGVWLILFVTAGVIAIRFALFLEPLFALCCAMVVSRMIDWSMREDMKK